jgi:selenide,water dikinase
MQQSQKQNIKLTQYSHGAGCGCKISPKVLSTILESNIDMPVLPNLLVGNDSRDDAAVLDMGNGTAIISTTDFFMPIVDDPFTFGKIAATNAISDVFAMGGKPILAIAILGWPINKLAPEIAREVVEGGRQICKEVGISLAGGHSIDSPEPIFGLAVTGQVDLKNIKQNDTATEGCKLLLTKPLGVGILTTAQKHGVLLPEHENIAPELMCKLNSPGFDLAKISGVKAMTDVTGFGLLGHLTEMCEGSNLSAQIDYSKIPQLPMLTQYLEQNCIPGGTIRNWESYGNNIFLKEESYKNILCDPQTSGGLLLAVDPGSVSEVQECLKGFSIETMPFGKLIKREENLITVV